MTSRSDPRSLQFVRGEVDAGITSPAREIDRTLTRIKELDPSLKAFVRLAPPRTLQAARSATGPLRGITLGVKDIFDTGDMPSEYGSPIYSQHQPRADAPLVAKARSLGAAIVGKTTTTEFAFLNPTATRNPHDPAHTPGGSSSGSAAAVAAGLVSAAFGTQTAGSTIRPASFCGIAGFKPSFRLLPTVGVKAFSWSLDTAGLFAVGVRDVATLAALLSGRDLMVEEISATQLRVGVYRSAIDGSLYASMAQAWDAGVKALQRRGVIVVEIEEPEPLARAREVQPLIQNFEGAVSLMDERTHHADALSPLLRAALNDADAIAPNVYDDARRVARDGRRAASALFDRVDVLIAPSAPGAAPRTLAATGDPAFNRIWTLAGTPCVNVPGFTDDAGMPLGLTIIARFGRDRMALSAGALLEEAIRAA